MRHSRVFLPVFSEISHNVPTPAELNAFLEGTRPDVRIRFGVILMALQGVAMLLSFRKVDPRAFPDLWQQRAVKWKKTNLRGFGRHCG
jgi:hypothetical protein